MKKKKKTGSAAGSSPSMQHLVFWPHAGAGAWGAGVILPRVNRVKGLTRKHVARVVCYESREKNLLIPAAAGSFSLDATLVFWPHAGAWGAGVILPPCAQLLWCRVVCNEEFKKKKKIDV